MDTSALEGIGLTKNEISIFILLLKVGETKAGAIISESGLQSSAVYNAINSLIKKGLVSYITIGKIKFYKAASPEVIIDYLDVKKEEYLSLLPQLQSLTNTEDEGVEYYKSIKGIKTLLLELMRDSNKGDTFRFFSISDPDEYLVGTKKVYEMLQAITKEKGIITKGIFSNKTKKFAKDSSVMHKRYLNTPLPPNIQLLNNKVAIISWKGDEPTGTLIKSKDIYDSYISYFEHVWETAKK